MEKGKMTLLVMAAGMGSRFGGLKQIEPFGPSGEFLTDYSVYDAIKVGFTKVVFIIKEENLQDFKDTIGKRIEQIIPVEYAFQKQTEIPKDIEIPQEREKPWGTAHAILCAKDKINENFVCINADDFYGYDAFKTAADFLRKGKTSTTNQYALVGYNIENTLTENGSVKRGICKSKNNYLAELIESKVERINGKIEAKPLNGSPSFSVDKNTLVSMNMLVFTPSIFSYIENQMNQFFQTHADDLTTCEFLIPDVLSSAISDGYATVEVLPTTAKWIGVTYKEDTEPVVKALRKMIEEGEYPENLWKRS